MDYIKEIQEAIELFKKLDETTSKKTKLSLIEETKGNEITEKLVELLKDEKIEVSNLSLSASVAKNSGNVRLMNYVRFTDRLTDSVKDPSALSYRLKFIDEEELVMYRAILSKTITLPTAKAKGKEMKKEEEIVEEVAEENAHEVAEEIEQA